MLLRFAYLSELIYGRITYTDIFSNKICRGYGNDVSEFLYTKIRLLEHPFTTAMQAIIGTTFVFAYLL